MDSLISRSAVATIPQIKLNAATIDTRSARTCTDQVCRSHQKIASAGPPNSITNSSVRRE